MKNFVKILVLGILVLWPAAAGAEFYYFHDDHLGGSSVVTDADGDVTAIYDYFPYGETYQEEVYDPDFMNSYKFTGQEEDSETGLYYYGARYYDAGVGRFYSQDPAVYDERLLENLGNPQALNPYSYVLNNPVKYTDPSGESAFSILFWKSVVAGLNILGYDITSEFLNYSIVNSTTDSSMINQSAFKKDTKKFTGSDNVGQAVRQSSEYTSILNDARQGILNGKKSGDDSFEFTSDTDLALAIGKADYSYEVLGNNDDGTCNVKITISDTYNFDSYRGYEKVIPSIGNNAGMYSQEQGYLTNYGVEGVFYETFDSDSGNFVVSD